MSALFSCAMKNRKTLQGLDPDQVFYVLRIIVSISEESSSTFTECGPPQYNTAFHQLAEL